MMDLSLLNDESLIESYHYNYETNQFNIKDLKQSKIFYLKQERKLEKIDIKAKKNYDFVVLKGYYLSYQLVDQVPIVFSNGIIEYYLPQNKNGKIKMKILESNIFSNEAYINQVRQTNKKSNFNISRTTSPFYFYDELFYNNKYTIENDNIIIDKNRGKFNFENEKFKAHFVFNTPQNFKTTSLFGTTFKTVNYYQTEEFNKPVVHFDFN